MNSQKVRESGRLLAYLVRGEEGDSSNRPTNYGRTFQLTDQKDNVAFFFVMWYSQHTFLSTINPLTAVCTLPTTQAKTIPFVVTNLLKINKKRFTDRFENITTFSAAYSAKILHFDNFSPLLKKSTDYTCHLNSSSIKNLRPMNNRTVVVSDSRFDSF